MRARAPITILVPLAALAIAPAIIAGCSSGGGSGGGAVASPAGTGSTPGGSTTPGGTTPGGTAVGPLLQKALGFGRDMQLRHTPDGVHFNIIRDASTGQITHYTQAQSGAIWTGTLVAAEAERYRATGSADALGNMERSVRALLDMHDITGVPGRIARSFGRLPEFTGSPNLPGTGRYAGYVFHNSEIARDQYTGWMLGIGLAWPHIQDPQLRADCQRVLAAVAGNLMANDLKLVAPDRNGTPGHVHFNLNPDQPFNAPITAADWATIDDFPVNLLAQAIPYDPLIADALYNARFPPIQAGEALRALMFFRVAADVTGDPAIDAYYHNVLLGQKSFGDVIRRFGTIQDDIFSGRNLHEVQAIMLQLGVVIGDVLQAYLQARVGFLGPILGPIARQALQPVLDAIMRTVSSGITAVIGFLSNPSNLQTAQQTVQGLNMLGTILSALGLGSAGRQLTSITGSVAPYANSSLEEARRSLSSGVGNNLTWTAIYGLCELETDPNIRSIYTDMADRKHEYTKWTLASYFNFIHGTYSPTGADAQAISEAVDSLRRHYGPAPDNMARKVDNSGLPGVVVSPWPNRFGSTGGIQAKAFPLDQRAPHHYLWQGHPGQIVSGSDTSREEMSGLGYLIAYWLGRRGGFVDPTW